MRPKTRRRNQWARVCVSIWSEPHFCRRQVIIWVTVLLRGPAKQRGTYYQLTIIEVLKASRKTPTLLRNTQSHHLQFRLKLGQSVNLSIQPSTGNTKLMNGRGKANVRVSSRILLLETFFDKEIQGFSSRIHCGSEICFTETLSFDDSEIFCLKQLCVLSYMLSILPVPYNHSGTTKVAL